MVDHRARRADLFEVGVARPRARGARRCGRARRRRDRRPSRRRGSVSGPQARSGWRRRRRPGSRPPAPGRRRRSGASGGRRARAAPGACRSTGQAARQHDDLGAVERERADRLREELVVAEQHPDPADRRVEGGEAVAGPEREALARRQVDLALVAEHAVAAHAHRRRVEVAGVAPPCSPRTRRCRRRARRARAISGPSGSSAGGTSGAGPAPSRM